VGVGFVPIFVGNFSIVRRYLFSEQKKPALRASLDWHSLPDRLGPSLGLALRAASRSKPAIVPICRTGVTAVRGDGGVEFRNLRTNNGAP
jgi:hypothetical protein